MHAHRGANTCAHGHTEDSLLINAGISADSDSARLKFATNGTPPPLADESFYSAPRVYFALENIISCLQFLTFNQHFGFGFDYVHRRFESQRLEATGFHSWSVFVRGEGG